MPRRNNSNAESFIPLPEIPEGKTETEILGEHDREIKRQGKILDWTLGFVLAVLAICFIGFLTFLYNEINNNTIAYRDYTNTIREMNKDQRLNLEKRIEKLENAQIKPTLTPTPTP